MFPLIYVFGIFFPYYWYLKVFLKKKFGAYLVLNRYRIDFRYSHAHFYIVLVLYAVCHVDNKKKYGHYNILRQSWGISENLNLFDFLNYT